MTPDATWGERLAAENDELRQRLAEAKEALEAIRQGEVDAVVVNHSEGPRIYMLTGADQPYRVMVEEMQEGAVTLGENCIVVYCNKQIARMLGTEHQNLLGASFRDFVTAESLSEFDSLWQRSRSAPVRGEVDLRVARGEPVQVHLTMNLLPSEEVDQTSVVITDLTEQKKHQAMAIAEALARKNAAELIEADRRKDEFLAMLSHELRNPLTPIRNGIDILQILLPAGEQAKQVADMMEEQALNLVHLIDDLLDVSRCSQGKLELRRQKVALSNIITNAIQTAERLIRANGHELTVAQAPESLYLHGDRTRLTQVVSNMLNNAAKYTPPGGKIMLATRRIGDQVAIHVSDNGSGISPEMLPRIFELFVQADNSLNRTSGGLGIGLTLVKRLAEMHGGAAEAKSDGLGKGSEFIVRLPILRASDALHDQSSAFSEEKKTFPSHRVLIVDDLRPAASIIAMLLRSMGQKVRTAASAPEALTLIDDEKPELILSDISMPEMTGYEFAREVRRRPEWQDIRLVAVTGYGQESDVRKAIEAGFNSHVVKPITKADLERLLASLAYTTQCPG